ncbi:MAG: AsmA-like C-terminal region-containing protein [Candidatus Scalindua sp.]|nr:AsmA-like C-terminal region-containing protein [Candidatus Scalindua sp.]MDV5165535.1 AsmA-like C-terminal region-containing protein [Candidatus Scalindua sp.]
MVKSKVLLILIIVFSVVGCLLIGGYVTLKILTSDKAIKIKITSTLEDYTGGKVDIENAHFDFSKGITLNNFKFEGKDAEKLRIEIEKIFIRYEPLALLRGEILINSVMIFSPELFLLRQKGAIWKFISGVKAYLDHANISYPTEHLRGGVVVKSANVHVFDEEIFRGGVLDIENLDLFGQYFGGSLRDINIKGAVHEGFWKGFELIVDTNFATPELKVVASLKDETMTEELMKELPVIGEKFWKEYSPEGKFDFDCTLDFDNKDGKEKLDYLLVLDIADGKTRYVKWPFLVKHVNGKLEFSREGVFLRSVRGDVQNEGQHAHGEIDAFFGVGNARKSINLSIPNFNITETLLKMIPNVGEKVWNDYHPKGSIDLTVHYESNEDDSVVDYSAKASCKGVDAENPFVPYNISNIMGLLEIDGKNVYLKNLSGYFLNGSKTHHSMIDGIINLKSKEKSITVSIPNLDMTEDVVKNIPKTGADIWSKYKPTGQVGLLLNYKGFADSSKDEYVITVDGKGNKVEYTDLSIELVDVIGRVIVSRDDVKLKNMRGYIVNGNQLARTVCDGVYILRSKDKKTLFNALDLQVTQEFMDKFPEILKKDWLKIEPVGWVSVHLSDDVNEAEAKDIHSIIVDGKGCGVRLINFPIAMLELEGRLSVDAEKLACRKFTGVYCGGRFTGSIEVDRASPDGEYSGKFSFDKVSLQEAVSSFTKNYHDMSGVCEGVIEIQGKGAGMENFSAKGKAKLRDGYLSEVPAVLSILKLLSVSLPNKESFHTADVKYTISDKKINVEELEVFSDSIELGCIGTVGFDGALDLTVVAGLSEETFSQIPFVGKLMDFVVGGIRKKLTKVQVTGTISNPVTTMIGLKPFTYPITSIIEVLSGTKKRNNEDNGDNEEGNTETKADKKTKNRARKR